WLAIHECRLKNIGYNSYALFLKQLFALAVKDRIISESPMKEVKRPWKKPQTCINRAKVLRRWVKPVYRALPQSAQEHRYPRCFVFGCSRHSSLAGNFDCASQSHSA